MEGGMKGNSVQEGASGALGTQEGVGNPAVPLLSSRGRDPWTPENHSILAQGRAQL
jgi:hypothetical protein